MLIDKIIKFFTRPDLRFIFLSAHGFFNRMSDEKYLSKFFSYILGYVPDLENPVTFNEKTQWLKLHDRKPEYSRMVDKVEAKEFVASLIGEEHIIPTLGVWHRVEEIDFEHLPDQFVIKCNHNSGLGMYICKDKKQLNQTKVCAELRKGLKQNYYLHGREWPYLNVERRIIAEKFMSDGENADLEDYKVFTFGGEAKLIQVDYDRFTDHHRNFYSREWEYIPFTTCYPTNPAHQIKKPKCLGELITIAEKIACGAGKPKFLRVDLYIIKNQIYFGEMTFYHGSGFEKFYPPEYDEKIGKFIEIN